MSEDDRELETKKSRVPEFKSYAEEAEIWDTHDFTEFEDETHPVTVRFAHNPSNLSEKNYSMEIKWSDEDHAYIVTVPELPGCRTHGATYEEAFQQGKDAIESWIEASEAWGDPIPPPAQAKARYC